jgi:multidrug resistance protein, MATE family
MSEIVEIELPEPRALIWRPWAAEIRALMKLAGPVIVTQLMQMAILTTDVVMLGRLGKEALASAAMGYVVFYFVWLIGLGPTSAISPMIAHILGRTPGDRAGVRAVARMGLWAVLVLWLPLGTILLFAKDILLLLGQEQTLAAGAGRFVVPLVFGLAFSLGFQALRNYMVALGKPNASLWVMAATFLFNIAGDYGLIFGHFGLPALGLIGAGLATACSYTFSCLVMIAVVLVTPSLAKYRIFHRFFRPHWGKFADLFRLGMPIGMTMIFEAMLFNAARLLMGTFGTASIAANEVAINVPSLTFMVPLGIAMAATVRVGLAAGAGDREGARRAGFAAIFVAVAFMSVCAVLIAAFPQHIARLYFSGPRNADAIALAVTFLKVAAAFQIVDGIQVTAALSLRGLKDTQMPMWIAGASYWLAGFPMCLWLGIGLGLKGLGVWIGLAFALLIAAIFMCWRFHYLSRVARLG